jgi:hypothetical protein
MPCNTCYYMLISISRFIYYGKPFTGMFRKSLKANRAQIGIYILAFGLIGAVMLRLSRAATPSVSLEVENATSISATVVSDTTASGAKAVKFGSVSVCTAYSGNLSPTTQDTELALWIGSLQPATNESNILLSGRT